MSIEDDGYISGPPIGPECDLNSLRPVLMGRAKGKYQLQHHDAEDLVQRAMLKAWEKRGSYKPGTNYGAWVVTLLDHIAVDDYRKIHGRKPADPEQPRNSRPPRVEQVWFEDDSEDEGVEPTAHLLERHPSAEDEYLDRIAQEEFVRRVEKLPAGVVAAVRLYVEGYRVGDIARLTRTPERTVRQWLNDAARMFKAEARAQQEEDV